MAQGTINFQPCLREAWRNGGHERAFKHDNEHIHKLDSMYIPFDAALLHGRPTGPAGISSFHAGVTADFTAQQGW